MFVPLGGCGTDGVRWSMWSLSDVSCGSRARSPPKSKTCAAVLGGQRMLNHSRSLLHHGGVLRAASREGDSWLRTDTLRPLTGGAGGLHEVSCALISTGAFLTRYLEAVLNQW